MFNRPYLLLTLTALMWGCNAVISRGAVGEVSPMMLVWLRWVLVCVFVSPFVMRDMASAWPAIRNRLIPIFFMGVAGFTAFNALFYIAGHYTTAVNIGLLQGSLPIFIIAGAFLWLRTPITGLQAIGVVLTLIGVLVVATGGQLERLASLGFNPGDLMMVAACLCYSAYTVALKNRPAVSGLMLFAAMAFAALIASIPLVAIEAAMGKAMAPTALGWGILVFVSAFPSFLGQIFYMRGVDLIGPGRAGLFINLVPVFAAILAVGILGESFELYHAVAFGLVMSGIWIAERRQGR